MRMTKPRHNSRESGFAMLLVFAMMAAAAIMLYLELPRVIMQAQRGKEQTLIDRGEQYKRAIQLYVRKEKKYPQSIDDLEKSTGTRYLRRRYKDPFTGKDDWRLIHIDATGVFTDSLVHKAPDPNEKKEKAQTFVAEMPSLGNPDAGTDPNAPQNVVLQRRASDRPAAVAGAQPMEFNQDPGTPPSPDQFPQAPGVQPGVPGQPGQPYPGQAFPGQQYPGQQPGLPGGFAQPFPGQPGVIPPGQPGAFPQPGQQPFGSPPIPGSQQFPGQPGAFPPGVPLMPGQSSLPYMPQPQQQQQQSGGSFIGGAVTPSPSPFQVTSQPAFQFPGMQGAPGVASSQTGGAVPAPFPGGGVRPNVPGGSSNQAVDLIQRILTTPRQAPPGVGQGPGVGGMASGIAGIASKQEGEGIKIYKERSLYKEWEFLYDMKEDKTGQMAAAMGQGTGAGQMPGQGPNPLGGTPASGASPFGGAPGASPFGGQPGGFGQPGASPFGGSSGSTSQPSTPSSSSPAPFIGGAPAPPPQQQQPQRPQPQPGQPQQPARPPGPGSR